MPATSETVPCVEPVAVTPVTVSGVSPSGSVSLAARSAAGNDNCASSTVPLFVSSTATGGLLTGAPPTPLNAKTNVFGVPSVGPSGVLGWPSE